MEIFSKQRVLLSMVSRLMDSKIPSDFRYAVCSAFGFDLEHGDVMVEPLGLRERNEVG